MRCAPAVLMVRPASFGFNREAAVSNHFARDGGEVAEQARAEMDTMANLLRSAGVRVFVVEDRAEPRCVDAVFPNNWVMFQPDGTTWLCPMACSSRRAERRVDAIQAVADFHGTRRIVDLTPLEASGESLEGTGSLVFDPESGAAYAALSPRTTPLALQIAEAHLGVPILRFVAELDGAPVYHTNVVLAIGPTVVFVAEELITEGRDLLLRALAATGRRIVRIDAGQVRAFAGNVLFLTTPSGVIAVLSRTAVEALHPDQDTALGERLVVEIPTIERVGGGSARCMMAEVFPHLG